MANRLRETKVDLYQRFLSYPRTRDDQSDSYSVCLTCDEDKLTSGPVDAAGDLSEVMEPLMLRVVPLHAAVELIDAVGAKLSHELDPADD